MLNLRITLRFINYNKKKFLFLLLTITLGTLSFYFILNTASNLENKGFRIGSDGRAHIIVNLNERLDNSEVKKIENELSYKTSFNFDLLYSEYYVLRGNFSGGNFKVVSYNDKDDLIKAINLVSYKKVSTISDINDPIDDSYHFEGIISRNTAVSYLRNRVDDYEEGDEITNFIYKKVDPYTKEVINIKIVDVIETDLTTWNNVILTIGQNESYANPSINGNLEIISKNPLDSKKLKKDISPYLISHLNVDDYNIIDWQERNDLFVNLIYVERVSIFLIELLTAIAISIGISNVISFDIKEKTNQIGILKALGYDNKRAISLFHLQASIISALGVFLGILLGSELSKLFVSIFTRKDGIPLIYLNQSVFNKYSIFTIIVMFIFNQLGLIIPDRNIKRMKIIDIIKEEG